VNKGNETIRLLKTAIDEIKKIQREWNAGVGALEEKVQKAA